MWTFDTDEGVFDIGYALGNEMGTYMSPLYTDDIMVAIKTCHYLNGGMNIDATNIEIWLNSGKLKVYE
jgi:hypothetical protein